MLVGLLLMAGLAAGFLIPYLVAVDHRVQEEFGRLQWQVPTRVYARPLTIEPGMPMNAEALEIELEAARYRDDGAGTAPGRYARRGVRWVIASRGFRDVDGPVPARRIEVELAKGRVRELIDAATGKAIASARLDPARIATLYGTRQEERELVRLDEVPTLLITTLQAVEDRSFKDHMGVDPWAIVRAMWVNLTSGEVRQGGSTLTQQLVRNLFLDRGQRLTRKFNEWTYALVIEARFDKRRILEAYLNHVYLGQDGGQAVHGFAAAANFWFGQDLASLAPQDIALLVGMIQGPSHFDPRRYPERALARRNLVLEQMVETGLIDPAQSRSAMQAPLGISTRPSLPRNRYPAFLDLVRRQLAEHYPEKSLRGAGLTVMTTLAPATQHLAEQAVAAAMVELGKDRPKLEAGVVVTEVARGEVEAMVGGRDPLQHGFNRALEAQRPIGSLMKPFVYLLALAQPGRYSLASPLHDAPITVQLARGKTWSPDNSDRRSHGWVRVIDALSRSYNQATVRLGMEIGVERLVRLLHALSGVEPTPRPSLLLGSIDLSPYQTAQLFQFLAAQGRVDPLRAVRAVLDAEGRALNRYDDAREAAQRGDQIAARLVTLALQETARSGTAQRLAGEGLAWLDPAGKTGTSNDSRDSWFAGYTGSQLAVVWVGHDDNSPTGLMGSTGAMRVWSQLFRKLPTEPLRVGGEGIEWAWIDAREYAQTDEDCEGARRYPFVAGYTPREFSRCGWVGWREWFDRDRDRDRGPGRDRDPRTQDRRARR
ncbi:MAG TPA: penicillin-binding protein 1B [Xanthomonadaceae bacterium]|nr:penicillin-binding protein 1B [Xanthomonadaceae bacterium]